MSVFLIIGYCFISKNILVSSYPSSNTRSDFAQKYSAKSINNQVFVHKKEMPLATETESSGLQEINSIKDCNKECELQSLLKAYPHLKPIEAIELDTANEYRIATQDEEEKFLIKQRKSILSLTSDEQRFHVVAGPLPAKVQERISLLSGQVQTSHEFVQANRADEIKIKEKLLEFNE